MRPQPSPSRWKTILAIGVVLVALIAAVMGTIYVVLVKAPSSLIHHAREEVFGSAAETYELCKRIAEDVSKALQFTPQVQIVNGPIVVEKTTPITELATAKQQFTHSYSWSESWMGSTKTIEMEGTFIARAGVDLRKPFSLVVDQANKAVEVRMPAPELLSVEIVKYKIITDEDGWWNKLSAKDRQDALNSLLASARMKELDSGILLEAQRSLEQTLDTLLRKQGAPSITYRVTPRN
jgi:hypothetical protein